MLIQPEPIADDALHIIAVMGAFGSFFADNQTKARMAERVVCGLGDLQQIAAASVFNAKTDEKSSVFNKRYCFEKP